MMQLWPTILRWMWIVAALVIGIYAGGSVVVRPFLPNGWPNPGIILTPICAIFALLLLVRSRKAWTVGMAMLVVGAAAFIVLDAAYDKLGWRTVGLCFGQVIPAYSIWGLKGYEESAANSEE